MTMKENIASIKIKSITEPDPSCFQSSSKGSRPVFREIPVEELEVDEEENINNNDIVWSRDISLLLFSQLHY